MYSSSWSEFRHLESFISVTNWERTSQSILQIRLWAVSLDRGICLLLLRPHHQICHSHGSRLYHAFCNLYELISSPQRNMQHRRSSEQWRRSKIKPGFDKVPRDQIEHVFLFITSSDYFVMNKSDAPSALMALNLSCRDFCCRLCISLNHQRPNSSLAWNRIPRSCRPAFLGITAAWYYFRLKEL